MGGQRLQRGRAQTRPGGPRTQLRSSLTVVTMMATIGVASVVVPSGVADAALPAPTSDDFSASSLDSNLWTTVDPLGDGSISVDGTRVLLSVPSGTAHNPWSNGNDALRLMQPVGDVDFEVEAKFESGVGAKNEMQGIFVEESPGNYLRFDVYGSGSNTKGFAASFSSDVPTTQANVNLVGAEVSPIWLRVTRAGSTWSGTWSTDGVAWTTYATFTSTLVPSSVGPFAGNAGTNPAHTAIVDYFFDTAAPIDPEDGSPSGSFSVTTSVAGSGSGAVTRDPDLPSYAAGSSVSLTASPGAGSSFTGWSGDATGATNPLTTTVNSDLAITANFATTGGSTAPDVDIWHGNQQSFGLTGTTQEWINILGNVSDDGAVTSLTYSLNGGSAQPLAIGPDGRRLHDLGDFNADIHRDDLVDGSNTVTFVAEDDSGEQTTSTTTVDFASGNQSPTNVSVDWSAVGDVTDVAEVIDGSWEITADGLRTSEPGYDRLVGIGDVTWDDYEVLVPITIHDIEPGSPFGGSPGVGLMVRWQGHTDDPVANQQPKAGFNPNGNIGWFRNGKLAFYSPSNTTNFPLVLETTYLMRLRVETLANGDSKYLLKAWEIGTSEPLTWPVSVTEPNDLPTGSVLLLAHHMDVTFGDVAITPLDEPGDSFSVTTQVSGTGSVSVEPNQASYPAGSSVTLTAVADTGSSFAGWSGDASGSTNPLTMTVDSDLAVTATFTGASDTTPPVVSGVSVAPGASSASVSWSTDEAASGVVTFGETAGYELGSVSTSSAGVSHSLMLTGLAPETTYHFEVVATDPSGNSSSTGDATFVTSAAVTSVAVSDDFSGAVLDSGVWTVVDPVGDGSVSLDGSRMSLAVPGGVEHDVWEGGNESLRVMQPVADADFEVEVKFESSVGAKYQLQGVIVEESPGNYLRFDVHGNGRATKAFAASFVNDVATIEANTKVAGAMVAPVWLRVARTGSTWTGSVSFNGVVWETFASFGSSVVPSSIGPFAGNSGNDPAHTAIVDYFFDTSNPVDLEDG